MIIRRFLPRTDDEFSIAINRAFTTMGIVIPSEMTLRPATKARLIALHENWNEAQGNSASAMAAKTNATALMLTTKADAQLFIRHFIMVFNLGVERGIYSKAQRILFYLKANSSKLPNLNSSENSILWGERIVEGDARRVAAGGAPMSNPSAEEVNSRLFAFVTASNDQSLKTSAWKDTLQVLVKLRKEAKIVIKKVWDETEIFHNELPPATKRDRCRPWGIIYKSDTEMIINLKVTNSITKEAIENASALLVESGTTHTTSKFGSTTFRTTIPDKVIITVTKQGFQTVTTEINFEKDVVDYDVMIRMVPA